MVLRNLISLDFTPALIILAKLNELIFLMFIYISLFAKSAPNVFI